MHFRVQTLALSNLHALSVVNAVLACLCAAAAGQYGDTTPFHPYDPGLCRDQNDKCPEWAKSGECERNAKYMLGDLGSPGQCALSCGACKSCKKEDRACYAENRRKAGFLVYTDLDVE
jgi:hypothetical protein